jgi:hypothetical protein
VHDPGVWLDAGGQLAIAVQQLDQAERGLDPALGRAQVTELRGHRDQAQRDQRAIGIDRR